MSLRKKFIRASKLRVGKKPKEVEIDTEDQKVILTYNINNGEQQEWVYSGYTPVKNFLVNCSKFG